MDGRKPVVSSAGRFLDTGAKVNCAESVGGADTHSIEVVVTGRVRAGRTQVWSLKHFFCLWNVLKQSGQGFFAPFLKGPLQAKQPSPRLDVGLLLLAVLDAQLPKALIMAWWIESLVLGVKLACFLWRESRGSKISVASQTAAVRPSGTVLLPAAVTKNFVGYKCTETWPMREDSATILS